MKPLRKAFCRAYQTAFRAALPVLPYREPKILHEMSEVADTCKELGVTRVMVVTDPGIAKLGLADDMVSCLEQAGVACSIFADTVANPTVSNVEEVRERYLADGCQAIIGFGGGSAMDCAKGAAARIAKPKQQLSQMRGVLKVHARTPLLIAVPTTAGTGSEVTVAAVITDDATHYKYPINDFCLIPRYAVHDYKVTEGLPPSITATTGMDALTHAVEAYIGRSTTRYTRQQAEEAVALIYHFLTRAYDDGTDIEARKKMQLAAYQAGIAFTQSYVGYVHGVAHSLGGQYGIPHGLANAIILPHFLRAYGASCAPQLARLSRLCGISAAGEADDAAAAAFIEWIDAMNERMGIPKYVEGIKIEDIPMMAAHADAESNPLYPVPRLMDKYELQHMYYVVGGLLGNARRQAAQPSAPDPATPATSAQ